MSLFDKSLGSIHVVSERLGLLGTLTNTGSAGYTSFFVDGGLSLFHTNGFDGTGPQTAVAVSAPCRKGKYYLVRSTAIRHFSPHDALFAGTLAAMVSTACCIVHFSITLSPILTVGPRSHCSKQNDALTLTLFSSSFARK
jgi:hypothetical protein